jgi:hypothetical protein
MAGLVLSIVLHAVLGVALGAVIWGVGTGLLSAIPRSEPASWLVFAYPLGLLAVTVASFAFLLSPVLGAIAALGLVTSLVPLMRRRGPRVPFGVVRALAWASPFVLALPFVLGLLLHGPTSAVPSSAYGDYVFWAVRAVSAARSIAPFDDLLVAGWQTSYSESGGTWLGAVFTHLPGFDVFLFICVSLPTVTLGSIALGFLVVTRADVGAPRSPAVAAVVAALVTASVVYPTWLAESAPVSLALPLVFALYVIWRERLPFRPLVVLAGIVAIDFYATKGVGVIVLAIVFGAAVVRDHRAELENGKRVAAGLVVAASAIGVLWRLGLLHGPTAGAPGIELKFVPADAVRGVWSQLTTRSVQQLGLAFEVIGELLLALALLRSRCFTLLIALGAGIATSWFVRSYNFESVAAFAVALSAVHVWQRPDLFARFRGPFLGAGGCLAAAAWMRDPVGVRAAFVLVLLFGTAVFMVLTSIAGHGPTALAYCSASCVAGCALAVAGHPLLAAGVAGMLALLANSSVARVAAVAAVTAGAVASSAAVSRGSLHLSTQRVTLTTDDRDVWRAVTRSVPEDALIFTSMTGESRDAEHGWNYYPGIGGRQLYIGGWLDGPLALEPEARMKRLDLNKRVLSGSEQPGSVAGAEGFDAYYAVVRRRERVPPAFRKLYTNDRFVLYQIQQGRT